MSSDTPAPEPLVRVSHRPAAELAPEGQHRMPDDVRLAVVTLDSPHNRNALSRRLVAELLTALDEADRDPSVRAVLLRATGKVFCSGADLSEAVEGGMEQGARGMVDMQRAVLAMETPVVAAVQGPVRAGGIGLVGACDVAIASRAATFALTEVRLGLAPAVISLVLLHRMTPRGAQRTFLDGEVFDGDAAAAYGLVTESVGADELDAAADRVCAALLVGSAQGQRETKLLLNREVLADLDARREEVAATSARLFGSEEAREAMGAFLRRKG
ncbi:enoyl-CoA hydratase-related protein [Nocardioides sp. CFH 31398]|uniref:enoyl-CoA hydratase-related protein n=1 Tax=Nocardioides sp. CFH 31398 TaxID=2919579 RepID=UPI001F05B910|nr:enoyl-CoA hydratase-related protein [Nocardioides sp. CFH 31398]MCH1867971.1 enoyl-CoA hydratase-related protein [Nocardioides sp. CFH 31398]